MSSIDLLDHRVASAFFGNFVQVRDLQLAAIEPIISGRNIVLTSGTGSGKTEAVMAPLISKYWSCAAQSLEPFLLYLAPTKALVNDLEKRLSFPLSQLGLTVGIRHGDRNDLKKVNKPSVLLTTPESLDVLLFKKDPSLLNIQALIIDEVHLLYNTQRGLQLSISLKRLEKFIQRKLQWAALSATIADLSNIRDFIFNSSSDAEHLTFKANRNIDGYIGHASDLNRLNSLIFKIMTTKTKLLIFVDSRKECERIAAKLSEDENLKQLVIVHYSSLSQELRVENEQKFANLDSAICIATSTLELGIDIGDIDAVVLWGIPNSIESFLQRIGRGNRRTHKNNVVCIVPDRSKNVLLEAMMFSGLLQSASQGDIANRKPFELYGAINQQCLSTIASEQGRFTRISDMFSSVEHKSYLDRDTFENMLAEMESQGFIQKHGYKNRYGADEMLYKLVDLKLIYGNFGVSSSSTSIFHGSKCLGEVPSINMLRLHKGSVVRFAGKPWKVTKINPSGIFVESSTAKNEVTDILYAGSKVFTDFNLIENLWYSMFTEELNVLLYDKNMRNILITKLDIIRSQLSKSDLPYIKTADGFKYFTYGGYLVNKAVGLYSRKTDLKVDDVSLSVISPINWESIPTNPFDYESVFTGLFEATMSQSYYQKLLPTNLQIQEYLQEWLKNTIIPKILTRLKNSKLVEIDQEIAELLSL